jgi:sensor histidine kinase regulating citrate/malate metabolism
MKRERYEIRRRHEIQMQLDHSRRMMAQRKRLQTHYFMNKISKIKAKAELKSDSEDLLVELK